MINVVNQMPFLRTSREFPEDINSLTQELEKSYIDTALCINQRIIGIYPTNRPAITGESYFLVKDKRQQTLRQIYTFTSVAPITHNIKNVIPGQFINCFGSYTDGINTFGIPFASSVLISGQITFYVTSTQIILVENGTEPVIASGIIVLTWLAQ